MDNTQFSQAIIAWQKKHGRHHLPWQKNTTPYRVWVSEIMLQQTQVKTVIPYYQRFMKSFPSLKKLAEASLDDVFEHWSGLGYYRRAKYLHQCAQQITEQYHGRFPQALEQIVQLPGIGRSTAEAIRCFAFNQPSCILDGNVKRIFCRAFCIEGDVNQSKTHRLLWPLAESLMPRDDFKAYNQGLMDIGATLCHRSKPVCDQCPLNKQCQANLNHQTHLYPSKSVKKNKTIRHLNFIAIAEKKTGAWLLEKRAATGIWASLWCLPEADNIEEWVNENLNTSITKHEAQASFTHQLTHLELHCRVHVVKCTRLSSKQLDSSRYIWYKANTPRPGGFPTPLEKILKQLNPREKS